MRSRARILAHLRIPCLLAAAAMAAACTTSGTHPAVVEKRDDGFTITEDVRAGLGVRSDFNRAIRLLEEEDYEAGIALLVAVTEAAPDSTTAHIDLGIAYRRIDDLERAEASLRRALELNPRHPAAHNEMGIVYRRTGRFDLARASYETALDLYPDFHFARRNPAILCDVFLKDMKCAIANYELYAQAVPDDEKASMWIADLRNRARNAQE